MTKASDYLTSEENYSPQEAKVLADIVSNNDFITLMQYKIGADVQGYRTLEVNFKVSMTMEDYTKIAEMMIENVRTKFGKDLDTPATTPIKH